MIFFIPFWVIIIFLLFGFVFGKMVIEALTSFFGVLFAIIVTIIIIVQIVKGIRRVMDDRSLDDDWSWEDN